uniref:(California timema) hypothetical protein n=1 Tax=Timema californicum TaxID=61474 RepID=A0A7R9P472_TIMCA|nr:unnamed protein product [Timema californicum]
MECLKLSFSKVGFQNIEEADNDEDNQPLQELVALLRRGHLDIDAEAVVSFNEHLRTEEGVKKAADLVQSDPADQEDDGVNIDEQSSSRQTVEDLKIKTYSEALYALKYFEKFSAVKNCRKVVELMEEAMKEIQKAAI